MQVISHKSHPLEEKHVEGREWFLKHVRKNLVTQICGQPEVSCPRGISYRHGFDFLPTRKRDKAGAARAVRRSRGFVYRSNQVRSEGLQVDHRGADQSHVTRRENCKAPFASCFVGSLGTGLIATTAWSSTPRP